MVFDQRKDEKKFLKEKEEISEVQGSLSQSEDKDKLMKSVLESGDDQIIDTGKVLTESLSRGLGSFTPDMFFESLVQNYQNCENIYGESLVRELTGYDAEFVKKNLNIPEFKRALQERAKKVKDELKKSKVLNNKGDFSQEAIEHASLLMLAQELDKLEMGQLGKRGNEPGNYGLKGNTRKFQNDKYKNLAIRQTIKLALRRGHKSVDKEDFMSYDLDKHKTMNVIYCLDTSGSMKGDKISTAKKAGIALSYKSIKEKNKAGLVIFNKEVTDEIPPSKDILPLLTALSQSTTGQETDLSLAIAKAIELLQKSKGKKHMLLVTDGMPTKGKNPINAAYEAASQARSSNITVSILGIELEGKAVDVAKKIVDIGKGHLYTARTHEDIEGIVLQDYYDFIVD